ncbi:molybdopterin dehydrogenase [Nocardiopsis sp. CNR-923]|uniref:FAD binding domain-containing protein n=1 Tax=Nocardiopsis sp. CNR-923 TaxID=1904965 RepID=UPI00095C7928|nr:xanthine dehydrogenase family protein subunit M [Nocardiopsis sp. CNR-923]OLT30606.1 molybdopterin dehydrogenase [Nocardiopsis sp. CNR-923]
MRDFAYTRAADVQDAIQLMAARPGAKFLGGGTNLVDLMREDVERPEAVIDVTGLPLDRVEERADGGLSIGATVRNTALAHDRRVRERYPLLAQSVLSGASGQIRNMATVGGNLMQRTRCPYFYDVAARCNKRTPGEGCDAIGGYHRDHAILGASSACIATHPSDMCVALAALDATVRVEGPDCVREIPFARFHRLPGDLPDLDTELRPDELITAVEVSALPLAANSAYRKVRDRRSYAFALVSVAAAVAVDGDRIADVRLALGGVAHRPWRARVAEEVLRGALATAETLQTAADAELADARGYPGNAFKVELARRTVVDALLELIARAGAR